MNNHIAISDETLSAYLDQELSAEAQDDVAAAVVSNPALATRLETLSRVNQLVRQQSSEVDNTPMPASVLALLSTALPAADSKAMTSNVLPGPWRAWRRHSGQILALAAGIAAVMITVNKLNPDSAGSGATEAVSLASYAGTLDVAVSGMPVALGELTLLNRFSFINGQQHYCRQYQLTSSTQRTENVACREEGEWKLVGSVTLPLQQAGTFQAASAPKALDQLLDSLMPGPALDLVTEGRLINQHWQESSSGK